MPDYNPHIPYALKNGVLVSVDDVPSGLACGCVCPCCGQRLVAHKGQVQSHHFQHESGASTCETPLHSTAKWMIYQRIDLASARNEPLPIAWQCHRCPCHHEGNLLDGVHIVFPPETPLSDTRIVPDLWMSKDLGMSASALIEIVVTHEPAPGTRTYARDGSIAIWEFHLDSAEDLEKLNRTPLMPDAATTPECLCSLCPSCNRRPCMMGMEDHRWCDVCQDCYREEPGKIHRHCTGCDELLNPYAAKQGYEACDECRELANIPISCEICYDAWPQKAKSHICPLPNRRCVSCLGLVKPGEGHCPVCHKTRSGFGFCCEYVVSEKVGSLMVV